MDLNVLINDLDKGDLLQYLDNTEESPFETEGLDSETIVTPVSIVYISCRVCQEIYKSTEIEEHERAHKDFKSESSYDEQEDLDTYNFESSDDEEVFSFESFCCNNHFTSFTEFIFHVHEHHFKTFQRVVLNMRETFLNVIENSKELVKNTVIDDGLSPFSVQPDDIIVDDSHENSQLEKETDSCVLPDLNVVPLTHLQHDESESVQPPKVTFRTRSKSKRKPSSKVNLRLSCKRCAFVALDKESLELHRKEYHSRGNFPCDECSRNFSTKFIYATHVTVEHGRLDYLNLVEDKVKCRKSVACQLCYKKFRTKDEMEAHKEEHQEPDSFVTCDHCNETFLTKRQLVQHISNIHTRSKLEQEMEGKFICGQCGARFSREFRLKIHEGNVHGTGQVKFSCPHCNKGFHRRYEFELHQLVHSNEFPHKCEDCGRTFKRAMGLKLHRRNLHSENETMKCVLCEQIFKNKDYLRSHVRKVHRMSLRQAFETMNLPYEGRETYNAIERKEKIVINKKHQPVIHV